MALHHAHPGEIVDVRPLGRQLSESISTTLIKTPHIQVFRFILKRNQVFAEHKVPDEITIQCLEGAVEFKTPVNTQILHAGELVYLARGNLHELKGIVDSSVLVTIVTCETPQG
ncbi:MAG: cupin [Gammaproteobacteria bacterium]|nr:cupin [Gammaproteobacteria bacterium]